ncbi:hypothetical protein EG850_12750 [Gulosibacter macacae]|uniref:Swt1-like HEPN domain-containing protein n=1 Tax=Gulosibacter macacae TaxID=2488791 RepID=A0A3P3VT01_9MICO|nr:hypothetical protein [Gulosibacter macacae]RRJ85584.1 hypothetical protein EG850_12750 [Gulosibacter macacae]
MAVVALERALRHLMAVEYGRAYGKGWLQRVTSAEQREKWEQKREDEQRRRPGVFISPVVGLEYSETYELVEIAKAHWGPLADALGRQKRVLPLLETFERIRNTASHSRDLVVFEREMMSGIAGEIRNKVTLHMTTQDPAGDYYPRIEMVADSFGTAINLVAEMRELAGSAQPHTVLHPGDIVTFRCSGVDPLKRQIEWSLRSTRREFQRLVADSDEIVELTWEVQEQDIVESVAAEIFMAVAGASYHRANGFDHRAYIEYRVRPINVNQQTPPTS